MNIGIDDGVELSGLEKILQADPSRPAIAMDPVRELEEIKNHAEPDQNPFPMRSFHPPPHLSVILRLNLCL